MKSKILFFVSFIGLIVILTGFYQVNQSNYKKTQEKRFTIIHHPEFLPKKEIAKTTAFGFKNAKADIYWLETIQYIGGNAAGSEYKKYLYEILDLITELNPYFSKPYLIGQLLLPDYNQRYESLEKEELDLHKKQAEQIGQKGIQNFCNADKMKEIFAQDDLNKLYSSLTLRNPCKGYDIPFQQAFLYYFYLKNSSQASQYYKLASMNDDSVSGAQIMAAIMKGKAGDREKSVLMFLNLAQATKEKTPACEALIGELETVSYATFQENIPLSSEIVQQMQVVREKYFPFSEKEEENIISGNNCDNYVNKAIRELNLAYIDTANDLYKKETGKNAQTTKELFDAGYISFQPTDFQQYDTYGIQYIYNPEIERFDYDMQ